VEGPFDRAFEDERQQEKTSTVEEKGRKDHNRKGLANVKRSKTWNYRKERIGRAWSARMPNETA
jgi:hypothetical protein